MTETAKRYVALLRALIEARGDSGGEISMAEESRFIEELDELWWKLTLAEQEEIERAWCTVPHLRDAR